MEERPHGCRRFAGRRVLVTGAGSGIGRALALRLGSEGAHVLVADIDSDRGAATAAAVPQEGSATALTFDQSNEASIDAAAEQMRGHSLHAVCVNAAVVAPVAALADVDIDSWDNVQSVNLRGAFLTAQRFAALLGEGGSIVFTASVAALRGQPGRVPYAVSKAGLLGLSRSLAVELGPSGIRVNTVCPGGTRTPLAGSLEPGYEAVAAELAARTPLRRAAEPEDVAAAIAFLISDDARHITGVDLLVDGGQCARP